MLLEEDFFPPPAFPAVADPIPRCETVDDDEEGGGGGGGSFDDAFELELPPPPPTTFSTLTPSIVDVVPLLLATAFPPSPTPTSSLVDEDDVPSLP